MRLLIIFWLVIFLLIFFLQWESESGLRELKRQSSMTTGKVIAVQPEQHQTVLYEYEVGGKTFLQSGGVGLIGKTIAEMNVGDSVPVYYLPGNPNISRIGNPQSVSTDLKSKLLSSLCFSAFVTFVSSLLLLLKKNSNYFATSKSE